MCCQCLALLGLSTGRTAPDIGCSLFMRPMWPVFSRRFLTESTGHSGCVWWCESSVQAVCNPLCAWIRWAPDASSAPSPVRSWVWQTLGVWDRWVPDASDTHLVASGGPQVTVRVQRARFKVWHVANICASDAGGRASGSSLLSVRCPRFQPSESGQRLFCWGGL